MKGKILGIILSIALCSSIFGIQFTNQTNYTIGIAIQRNIDSTYKVHLVKPGQVSNCEPFEDSSGWMLIGFNGKNLFDAPFPETDVTITENDNYFILTGKGYLFQLEKGKVLLNFIEEEKAEEKDEKQPKAGFFTLKKMLIAGGVAAIASYFIWNNYNKKQKANTTK